MTSCGGSDVDVVVLLEERHELLVAGRPAALGHLDQALEVRLAGSAGGEQDEQRSRFPGLVAEAVDAALGNVEEVARPGVCPGVAAEEPDWSRQHEERLGDG